MYYGDITREERDRYNEFEDYIAKNSSNVNQIFSMIAIRVPFDISFPG